MVAELPRCAGGCNLWLKLVRAYMVADGGHNCVRTRCFSGLFGQALKACKYGAPWPLNSGEPALRSDGQRWHWTRRSLEDCRVAATCVPIFFAIF